MSDPNDELLTEMRAVGRLDSEGAFTFDMEAARRKSVAYRLVDEDVWMIGPVMVAVGLGASYITMIHSYRDITPTIYFRFNGAPVPTAWTREIAAGRDPGPHPSARALHSAFLIAVAARAKRMEISTYPPDLQETELRRRLVGTRMTSGITVVLEKHIVPLSRLKKLLKRCEYAPLEVQLDIGRYSRPRLIRDAIAARIVHGDPATRLRIPFDRASLEALEGRHNAVFWLGAGSGAFTIVLNGVSFPGDLRQLASPMIRCVASASHLSPDLSMENIVCDPVYEDWVADVREESMHFIRQLCEVIPADRKDAERLVECVETTLRSATLPPALRGPVLAGLARLIGRCLEWRDFDRVALRIASLIDDPHGRLVEGVDAHAHALTVETLACALGVAGHAQEALRLRKGHEANRTQALLMRIVGRTAEAREIHQRLAPTSPADAIETAACALAMGEAEPLPDEASVWPQIEARRLDLRAQLALRAGRLDESIAVLEEAAAAEDDLERLVEWRRLRNMRGDHCGLGDGLGETLRELAHLGHAETDRLARSRLVNTPRPLHDGERHIFQNDWDGARDRFIALLDGTAQSPPPPGTLAGALRRTAFVLRKLGNPAEADRYEARLLLLRELRP